MHSDKLIREMKNCTASVENPLPVADTRSPPD